MSVSFLFICSNSRTLYFISKSVSIKKGLCYYYEGKLHFLPCKNTGDFMACKSVMDLHVHTDNSFDGHHSTMYMCETAVSKGLRAVAFTDHCEVDAYYKDNFDRSVRQSYIENAKARWALSLPSPTMMLSWLNLLFRAFSMTS
jgi:hypothetical protein